MQLIFFFNCQSVFTRHLKNLYLLNDHSSASILLWGHPFGSLAKTKVGAQRETSDPWLVLVLPMGNHNPNRTASGDYHSYTILLMYLSSPDLPIMTACFNHNNTVQKIQRNITDHVESPHPKRCSVKHDPKVGKGKHQKHSKENKESLQEYLERTRARGTVVIKYR